ncbi:GAF and ANTAR domain-containing protein [Rhodococcus sp. P1Y]|uniref:GAF and ANTAR domain-containing protein n=1 Tax=Rhodococcus sp. P1Y TaxID=1302308 RepID=UPI000EAF38FF|nr:GAF and ANTAR domain-containing protein [Rhodococcus sp. P1Y]AYJ47992.1 ANTAR domain-containing protein [Rhodococcus sp. P1Y]
MDTQFDRNRFDLGRALADATRGFFRPGSVEDTFRAVTESVTSLLAGADCADVLIIAGRNKFQSHAATSDLPVRLDVLQEEMNEGPCVDAAHRDVLVRCDDFATDTRWPRFGPQAVKAGVRSSLSFQLYTSDDTIGALNVFGRLPHAFTKDDEEVGSMFATNAALAVYAANKAHQFDSALASRDLIGQAKGMLMERYSIGAAQAFGLLSKISQDSNTPIAALASDVVKHGRDTPAL